VWTRTDQRVGLGSGNALRRAASQSSDWRTVMRESAGELDLEPVRVPFLGEARTCFSQKKDPHGGHGLPWTIHHSVAARSKARLNSGDVRARTPAALSVRVASGSASSIATGSRS